MVTSIRRGFHTVSFCDGTKTHKDGSDFYDIRIFKNWRDLKQFINSLKLQGYKII